MIDRLVHTPLVSSTVCEASESTLCWLLLLLSADPPPCPLFFLLVPQLTAAAECYGILLLLGQHSLRCSSSSSSLFLCLHPPYSYLMVRPHHRAPVFLPVSAPGLFPYYSTSTSTPTVCLVLDALDIDSISSFYGSSILL